MQAHQDNYFAAYGNLKLTRDVKGILVAQFHSELWGTYPGVRSSRPFVKDPLAVAVWP